VTYKATLGTTALLITIAISLFEGSIVTIFLYRTIVTTSAIERSIDLLIIIGISTHYLYAYLCRPIHYVVDGKYLTVKRLIKEVRIPINEIKGAFIIKKESMGWRDRVGGNGGLFGFYGHFKNDFGGMTWYATRLKNYIMIETISKDKIVITPDNTDLVKEIRGLIGK
jgi:Bacterial PH domain